MVKITGKVKDLWNDHIHFDLKKALNGIESFNTVVEAFHDVGSIGFAFVETLDQNIFIKMAYVAAGLGENFSPFSSGVVEFFGFFDAGPLTALQFYLKSKNLYEGGKEWYYCTPSDSPKKVDQIKFKLFTCSIEMLKEIAKVTLKALVVFGVISQVPFCATLIVSGVGIVILGIKVYNYFKKSDTDIESVEPLVEPSLISQKIMANSTTDHDLGCGL